MNIPWHGGELEMHRRAGVVGTIDAVAAHVIKDQMTEAQRRFLGGLPFVVAATIDLEGDVWATLLAGEPGFMNTADPQCLRISPFLHPQDPAGLGLNAGSAIGLLGIDLPTRRRSRLNGQVSRFSASSFDVQVLQSYGNCSKYIQQREFEPASTEEASSAELAASFAEMSPRAREIVVNADTFFVGSYAIREGSERMVDVSHKGGWPGFLRLDADGRLTIPDFAGNQFFNTLGNLLVNPRCGLVFADFETGDILQMTGDAIVLQEGADPDRFPGAQRLWKFTPRKIVLRRNAFPLRVRKGPRPDSMLQ